MTKIIVTKEEEEDLEYINAILFSELKDYKDSDVGISRHGMEWTNSKKTTVCSKLREIYVATNDEKIKKLTVEATLLAKKLVKRLIEYRKEKDLREKK